MGITAESGPLVIYGVTLSASGAPADYNDQRAPSLFDLGSGLMDPRTQYNYDPGGSVTAQTFGFFDNAGIVDYVPSAVSSNNIVLAQTPSSIGATGLTLSSLSSQGITGNVSIIAPETGKVVTGLWAIDGLCGGTSNAGVQFGQSATINVWNPATVCGRGISIVKSSNGDAGAWTIAGRDVYGFKVTESLVSSGNTTMNSKKTYKYISSILPGSATTSTGAIVGTQDLYGLPLRADSLGYISASWGAGSSAATITGSTNFVFAVTSAASNTTGDVRGTVTVTPVSTGGQRLTIFVYPSPINLGTVTSTNTAALFGLPQFSSV